MPLCLPVPTAEALPWMPFRPRYWPGFVGRQIAACIFPFAIFLGLGVTRLVAIPHVPRYDAMLVYCLIVQFALYKSGLETKDEMKVIAVFHLLGLLMEIDKTHQHHWSYPEFSWVRVGGVPLYSGFMYASVASYLCQIWRRLDIHVIGWPDNGMALALGGCIYLNFFTERFIPDLRLALIPAAFLLFRKTEVRYLVRGDAFQIPLGAAYVLAGIVIWAAENAATYLGAWRYPWQAHLWRPVETGKGTSWFLLTVVSFLIVAQLKHVKERRDRQKSDVPSSFGQAAAGYHAERQSRAPLTNRALRKDRFARSIFPRVRVSLREHPRPARHGPRHAADAGGAGGSLKRISVRTDVLSRKRVRDSARRLRPADACSVR